MNCVTVHVRIGCKWLGMVGLICAASGRAMATDAPRSQFDEPRSVWMPCALAFTPDGKQLAIAGNEVLHFRDVKTGEVVREFKEEGAVQTNCAAPMAISSDGKTVATRLIVSSQIRLWDSQSGKRIRELGKNWLDPTRPLGPHVPPMIPMTIDFAHDGKLVAISGSDDVIVYDAYKGDQKWSAQAQGLAVGRNMWSDAKFSPDGKILAGQKILPGQNAGSIELFDSETGKPLGEISAGRNQFILSVAWSPDGETLAFQESSGAIKLATVKTRKVRRTLRTISVARDHGANIAFSSEGSTLLAADASGQIVFLDPQSGKQQARIKSTGAHVVQIAVSPDGMFATGSDDNVVRIWNIPAAAMKRQPK